MKSQKDSGAAMLVVMLLLLSATAVATFAIQSTSYELRAVGGHKLFTQAEQNSEIALDSVFALVESEGPELIANYLTDRPVLDDSGYDYATLTDTQKLIIRERGTRAAPCGIDASLAADAQATRIPISEFYEYEGAAPVDNDSLGTRPGGAQAAYFPHFYVCAYDQVIIQTRSPGQELSNNTKLARRYTLTAQSYLKVGDLNNDGDYSNDDTPDGSSTASYHEVSNSARAHAVTIPYEQ